MYHALVLPHLDYCSVVWHSCGATLSTQIKRIQKYSMRLILRQPPHTQSEPLRRRLGWTSLHQRQHHALLKQVHRCINKRAPVYLVEKFQTNFNFGYCGTRGEGKLHLKQPLSNFYRSSFEFQGAFHFNLLPHSIRALSCTKDFITTLKIISCN